MATMNCLPRPIETTSRLFVSATLSAGLLALGAGLGGLGCAASRVVTYRAPQQEVLSRDYQVWVEDQPVDVYTARVLDPPFSTWGRDYGGPYSFANFDVSGKVAVRISAKRSLTMTVVRPQTPQVQLEHLSEHELRLTLAGPQKLSIEPDGKRGPLLLFANPMESNRPDAGAPGVRYFGPGLHKPGLIELGEGQTLYLAGGAVVQGAVAARGSNVRICGRGILDGSPYEWQKGPHDFTVGIYGTNVDLSGITIRGSSQWTIAMKGSRDVRIQNVKLCNSRVQNDDGIDPCNSQDVRISDCFIRSDDDCVALKGLDLTTPNCNVERITVENCILWCDRARVFLLGHESRAAFMRQITLRNLDIIHFAMTPFLLEPGEDMCLKDVTIENVRIHGEGQAELARLKPTVNEYMQKRVPGKILNVRFKNVRVNGAPGSYLISLEGADNRHDVKGVNFEDVTVLDRPLTREQVKIGGHATDVTFSP